MEVKNEIRVGARDLPGKLTRYLRLAAGGTTIRITSRDKVIAELKALVPKCLPQRRPGALKGQIKKAKNFDTLPAQQPWDFRAMATAT